MMVQMCFAEVSQEFLHYFYTGASNINEFQLSFQVDKFHKDQQSMSMNNGTSATPVVEVQAVSQWSSCQTKHLRHVQHQGGGGEGGRGGWPKLINPTYELGFHYCQSKVQATPKIICAYVWNYPEWLAFSAQLKNAVVVTNGEVQFSCFFYTNPVLGSCGETLDLSQDAKSWGQSRLH